MLQAQCPPTNVSQLETGIHGIWQGRPESVRKKGSNQDYEKGEDDYKRLIGELTIANDILKKLGREGNDIVKITQMGVLCRE